MGGLFGSKPPAPPPPPEPPTVDNSAEELKKAEESQRIRAASSGRASDLLTSGKGATDEYMTAKKKLGA